MRRCERQSVAADAEESAVDRDMGFEPLDAGLVKRESGEMQNNAHGIAVAEAGLVRG